MLDFSLRSTLQQCDCAEHVQDCIVFTAICMLHAAKTAASRFAVAVLNQLQCLLKQNREKRGCLHTKHTWTNNASSSAVDWLLSSTQFGNSIIRAMLVVSQTLVPVAKVGSFPKAYGDCIMRARQQSMCSIPLPSTEPDNEQANREQAVRVGR